MSASVTDASDRIRVAHIIWSGGIGGAERQLLNLSRCLNKEKYTLLFIFLSPEDTRIVSKISREGGAVEVLNWKHGFTLVGRFSLVRALRKFKPDIVHDHTSTNGICFLYKFLNTKVIRSHHGSSFSRKDIRNYWLNIFDAFFIDKHIAVSHFVKTRVEDLYSIPSRNIVTIPNGICLNEFYPRERDIRHPDKIRIGFLGRLIKEKGIFDFLELARNDSNPNSEYVVWGDGPTMNECEQFIVEHSLSSKVKMQGWAEEPLVAYNDMDILVFPSIWDEPFGLVPLESLAMGVPVVAYAAGAIRETLGNCPFAYLVKTGDIRGLSKGVERMIQNISSSRKEEMYSWVSTNYDISLQVIRLEKLYQDLVTNDAHPV